MGKANQGVFGSFTGKVGNVVGRVRQGQQVYCIYQPNVGNPQTPAQQANRMKITLLSQLGSVLLNAIQDGFKQLDGYQKGSPYSAFVGYNCKVAQPITGAYPNLEIDHAKVAVSEGSLINPYNCQGSVDSYNIVLTWADNSGMSNALATDQLCVVVLNKNKNASVYFPYGAKRSDRTDTVTCPSSWSSDSVEVWAFMARENGTLMSKTMYIGSFTL